MSDSQNRMAHSIGRSAEGPLVLPWLQLGRSAPTQEALRPVLKVCLNTNTVLARKKLIRSVLIHTFIHRFGFGRHNSTCAS